jgi:dihydroxy-acid dehydratase
MGVEQVLRAGHTARSQGASQAMLYGIGLTLADLQKPQLGICSMWYEGNTCNMHLRPPGRRGQGRHPRPAGLVGMRFNTIGVSDGLSMGTEGMSYSLPSRDPHRRFYRDRDARAVVRRARHHSRLRQEHAGQRPWRWSA